MIVFSVLAHEAPEMLQILGENYQKFVPGCRVIAHINKLNREEFLKTSISSVTINPQSYEVVRCEYGLVEGHISNFRLAQKGEPFSHFCMMASNVMFIKSGVEDYMNLHKNGIQIIKVLSNEFKHDPDWNWAFYDKQLMNVMRKRDWGIIVYTQFEGMFIETEKFNLIADIIEKDYLTIPMSNFYPREECIFGSIFINLWEKEKLTQPITFFFQFGHPTPETIELMREAKDPEYLFSFKRCPRDINHPLVKYLKDLKPTSIS